MASDILLDRHAADSNRDARGGDSLLDDLAKVLWPVASLKLTVALMAMAIFLILAGTLAQIDMDIWQVMAEYFRTPLAWIDYRIFFPRNWDLPALVFELPVPFSNWVLSIRGLPFPGGFTIGGAMLINLLAAHLLRFKVQARGGRMLAGLAVTAIGAGLTWFVVASGSNPAGLQDLPLIEWSTLWTALKLGLAALWVGMLVGLVRMEASKRIERIGLALSAAALGGLVAWLFFGNAGTLGDSSLRILWQLLKGGLAGVVLLIGCVLLFKKRAGVVLLHAGVALMMINELVVYGLHSEGQMHIMEGQTINYVQDIRTIELAVVDPSNPDEDDVVVVPKSLLVDALDSGQVIRDENLPFDVEVVRYLQNTTRRELKSGEENLADAGAGLKFAVDDAKPGTGTDMGGGVDMTAAYVRFLDKQHGDKPLSTNLLSVYQSFLNAPERVTADGKSYDVYLRFKRDYKPYSMHLVDVRFDKYMGTNTPRNYSSDLRLVDPTRNVDRKVHIWMNNPLRYAGETFYQSSFEPGTGTGTEGTGLSVVANAGWMIPYVACMIVAVGLLAHFSIVLVRFLNRRSAAEIVAHAGVDAKGRGKKARRAVERPRGGIADWLVPLMVVGTAAGFISSALRPPKVRDGELNLGAFGALPVMYDGRLKPIDTLARNTLRALSDSESYIGLNGKRQPAVLWLLEVMAQPSLAADEKVIRIQNLEVLEMLGLQRREGYRYAINEFRKQMGEFKRQADAAHDVEPAERSVYQKKVLELENRLNLYLTMLTAFDQPEIRPDHAAEDLVDAVRRQQQMFGRMRAPLVIPPASGEGDWEPYTVAWTKAYAQVNILQQQPNQATLDFNEIIIAMAKAVEKTDAAAFNKAVTKYQDLLASSPPADLDIRKIDFEAFFNRARLFFWTPWMYVMAIAIAALGWLGFSRPLNRAAFALIAFTFVLHTIALVSRIYISGRPPVTNLYSAAIFVGWGGVLLGMVLEAVYRLGIGNIIAGAAGFATLLIADRLASDGGDTFTVLQAVLDTQFWLATHVTCITFGYATTFVAGLLGMVYILGGVLTPSLTKSMSSELGRMIYGVVCFSIFFSFVGTVLGGLWADDSWGRFWGWDPKENGALIIVLWNALVLHARWDGMIKERGLAALAVLGNIAVGWSAFGVNQLSVGLHSYGFTEGIALALLVFVASQLAVVGLAMVPRKYWRSTRAATA